MTRSSPFLALPLLALLALACGGDDGGGDGDGDGDGDPNTVVVGANGANRFSPSSLTVPVGTTVTFEFARAGHNVVSGTGCTPDGTFCSPDDTACESAPLQAAGATYTRTFTEAGTFRYFCDPHCELGMTGTIVVQ